MRYVHLDDGEWVVTNKRRFSIACCDCGLVHSMDLWLKKDKVYLRLTRDRRATGQIRRWRKHG